MSECIEWGYGDECYHPESKEAAIYMCKAPVEYGSIIYYQNRGKPFLVATILLTKKR